MVVRQAFALHVQWLLHRLQFVLLLLDQHLWSLVLSRGGSTGSPIVFLIVVILLFIAVLGRWFERLLLCELLIGN